MKRCSSLPIKPHLLVVAAAVLDGGGRVLVQRRPEGRPLAGLWEFPGGKVEPGETPEAALARELDEELGLAVVPAAAVPLSFATEASDARTLVLLLYAVREWAGAAEPRHAAEIAWVDADALAMLAMPAADLPLVPVVARLLRAEATISGA